MKRVVIVQELVPQYRVPFYERLRERLTEGDVELRLVHGLATGDRAARRDEAAVDWADVVRNRSVSTPFGPAVWQPVLRHVRGADLVVVEAANRMLVNYLLLAAARAGGPPVALWGHGGNLQGDASSLRERWKRRVARQPHWWFAYTDGSAERVVAAGFPRSRITIVQNAIDTSPYARVTVERAAMPHCVYVGALHPDKRLPFLLDAGRHLAAQVPGFRLTIAGDGPLRAMLREAEDSFDWLRYVGPVFGDEKVRLMSEAHLMLMPGLVGLGILDAFAARTPLVTTDIDFHSPEYEYAVDGENSVVLPADATAEQYAGCVADLLAGGERLDRLRAGCETAARRFMIDEMATRFADGVSASIEQPILTRRVR